MVDPRTPRPHRPRPRLRRLPTPDVDLHHLDYADLGHETYDDLIPLCRPHHDRVHAAWDATPHLRRLGRRAGSLAIITAMRTGDTETETGRIAGASANE